LGWLALDALWIDVGGGKRFIVAYGEYAFVCSAASVRTIFLTGFFCLFSNFLCGFELQKIWATRHSNPVFVICCCCFLSSHYLKLKLAFSGRCGARIICVYLFLLFLCIFYLFLVWIFCFCFCFCWIFRAPYCVAVLSYSHLFTELHCTGISILYRVIQAFLNCPVLVFCQLNPNEIPGGWPETVRLRVVQF
jgi:hypothetical protein